MVTSRTTAQDQGRKKRRYESQSAKGGERKEERGTTQGKGETVRQRYDGGAYLHDRRAIAHLVLAKT